MSYYSGTKTSVDKSEADFVKSTAIKNYSKIGNIMCFKPEEPVRYGPFTTRVPVLYRDMYTHKKEGLMLTTPLLTVAYPPEKGKIGFSMNCINDDWKRNMMMFESMVKDSVCGLYANIKKWFGEDVVVNKDEYRESFCNKFNTFKVKIGNLSTGEKTLGDIEDIKHRDTVRCVLGIRNVWIELYKCGQQVTLRRHGIEYEIVHIENQGKSPYKQYKFLLNSEDDEDDEDGKDGEDGEDGEDDE